MPRSPSDDQLDRLLDCVCSCPPKAGIESRISMAAKHARVHQDNAPFAATAWKRFAPIAASLAIGVFFGLTLLPSQKPTDDQQMVELRQRYNKYQAGHDLLDSVESEVLLDEMTLDMLEA